MFEGAFNSPYNESIADMGARRTLGVGGSLVGYIETGNPYDKRYYIKPKKKLECDCYGNKCAAKRKSDKKSANIFIDKLITGLTFVGLSAAVVFGLVKSGKIKFPEKIGELSKKAAAGFSNLKTKISPKENFSKAKEGAKNLGKKITSAFKKKA